MEEEDKGKLVDDENVRHRKEKWQDKEEDNNNKKEEISLTISHLDLRYFLKITLVLIIRSQNI